MHPATQNKNIIRLGALACLVPFFVIPALMWVIAPPNGSTIRFDLWSQLQAAVQQRSVVVGAVLAIGVFAFLLTLVRRGVSATPLLAVILIGTTIGGWVTTSFFSHPPGFNLPLAEGTKVWCNGVYLGEGPIAMSFAEFDEKVKPVDQPPEQANVFFPSSQNPSMPEDWEWHNVGWEQVPGNPRSDYFGVWWPSLPDYNELMSAMPSEKYWWRFENADQVALSAAYVTFRPEGKRSSGYIDAKYPSRTRHIEVLWTLLERTQFKRTAEFDEHIQRYGLADSFEEMLQPATLPQAKPEITDVQIENQVAAEELLQGLLDRVVDAKKIIHPSRESSELIAVAQQYPDVIRTKLSLSPKWIYQFAADTSYENRSPDRIRASLIAGVASREKILNEDFFDEAVLKRKWWYILQFDRPEVAPMLRAHLQNVHAQYNWRTLTPLHSELELAIKSPSRQVQDVAREFLSYAGVFSMSLVKEFVARQVELGVNRVELANWVESLAGTRSVGDSGVVKGISKDELSGLLAIVGPEDFSNRVTRLQFEPGAFGRTDMTDLAQPIIDWAIEHDSTAEQRGEQERGNRIDVLRLLLRNHKNQTAREYLLSKLGKDSRSVNDIRNAIPYSQWDEYGWLLDEAIRVIDEENPEQEHMRVLAYLLADSESKVAQRKAADVGIDDQLVARYEAMVEKEREKKKLALLKDVRLAKRLIAGEIKPMDLIQTERLVWGEHGYERVTQESE